MAGIRTPRPIAEMAQELPEIYKQFVDVCRKLEAHYRDMQDIEFTIENGKLYILQTRNAKRTAAAAVKVVVDLVREGVISKDEALLRVEPDQLDQLLHRRIDPEAKLNVLAYGLPASPGAATGKVVFDPDRAQELASENVAVLLVRSETTPDDIHGIKAAQGVLTSRGGMTSHAAVVAQAWATLRLRLRGAQDRCRQGKFYIDGQEYAEGEVLSIDGATGE